MKMFLIYWISLFGSPNTVFSDKGGEFVSNEFIYFCENFNMKVKTTAAEAPWSNGSCECHNAIITDIISKWDMILTVIGKLPLFGQLVRKTV